MKREGGRGKLRVIRWANVLVRGAHQISVVGLGAAMLGAPLAIGSYAMAVVASGAVLMALELIDKPSTVFEASGVAMLAKLGLVAWVAWDPAAPRWVFWFIVGWSTLFAHAPGAFRHARLFCRGGIS